MWSLPQTPDVDIALGTLLAGAAAMWGAFTASKGLDRWKSESKWQRQNDLCEELLLLFRQRSDIVDDIRKLGFLPSPATRDEDGNEITDPKLANYYSLVQYYQGKLDALNEIKLKLYPVLIRAEFALGFDFSENLATMHECEVELIIAIRRFVGEQDPRVLKSNQPPFNEDHRRTLFAGSNDEFRRKYDAAIAPINLELREKLRMLYQ